MNCNVCGRPLNPGAKFCTGCGSQVTIKGPGQNYAYNQSDTHICPSCGRELASGVLFCKYCGYKIGNASDPGATQKISGDPQIVNGGRKPGQIIPPIKTPPPNPNKQGSGLTIILGIIMALIILIAGGITLYLVAFKEDNKDAAEATTEVAAEATTQSNGGADNIIPDFGEEEVTESTEAQYPEGIKPEYVTNAICDINSNLDKNEFQYVESLDGSYNFRYPKHLYNTFSYDDNSGYYFAYIDEYGNTVTSLRVYTQPCIGDIRTNTKNMRTSFLNRLYYSNYQYPMDLDKGKIGDDGILQINVGGWEDPTYTKGTYFLGGNDGYRNYIFEVTFPDSDPKNEKETWDFIVNDIYRYCSFSGTTKAPYTNYKAFLNSDD